jgi:hypothetical protein
MSCARQTNIFLLTDALSLHPSLPIVMESRFPIGERQPLNQTHVDRIVIFRNNRNLPSREICEGQGLKMQNRMYFHEVHDEPMTLTTISIPCYQK